MSGARAVGAAVLLASLAAVHPTAAVAAEPTAAEREARRHFSVAEAAYRAGHYADALTEYQAGYAAVPLPGFLVNIAQCQRRLGDLKTARATYREFILVAPDSRLRPEVEKLIGEIDALIADLAAGGAGAGAGQVATDAADVHASDPNAPNAPPPVDLALAAPVPDAPPLVAVPVASEAAHSHRRWWLWGGLGAVVVAGAVVTAVALSSPGTNTIHMGSLGTLSR